MLLPVTIGIPAYNEEKFIARSLRCALSQPVMKIIVSDNGSEDGTLSICESFAKRDDRLQILQQEINKGPVSNFIACLTEATTRYFMFLGAHDIISDNHVQKLVEALVGVKGAVGSYANATYINSNSEIVRTYEYFYARKLVSSSPLERLMALIGNLTDGTIFYGLYDRKLLTSAMTDENYIPCDLFNVGHMAIHGKLVCAQNVLHCRGNDDNAESREEKLHRYSKMFAPVDVFFTKRKNLSQRKDLTALRHMLLLNELYPDIKYKKNG